MLSKRLQKQLSGSNKVLQGENPVTTLINFLNNLDKLSHTMVILNSTSPKALWWLIQNILKNHNLNPQNSKLKAKLFATVIGAEPPSELVVNWPNFSEYVSTNSNSLLMQNSGPKFRFVPSVNDLQILVAENASGIYLITRDLDTMHAESLIQASAFKTSRGGHIVLISTDTVLNLRGLDVLTVSFDIPDEFLKSLIYAKLAKYGLTQYANYINTDIAVELIDYLSNNPVPLHNKEEVVYRFIAKELRRYGLNLTLPRNIKCNRPVGQEKLKEMLKSIYRNARSSKATSALFYGVAGTGKSNLAKCLARELNIPLIEFNLGLIKSEYTGQSEHRLRVALSLLSQFKKGVLWIDELGRQLAGDRAVATDSGVTKNLIGQLLTWLEEEKPKELFAIGTANELNDLSDALLRRFPLKVKFDFIPEEKREQIIKQIVLDIVKDEQLAGEILSTLMAVILAEDVKVTPSDIVSLVQLYQTVRDSGIDFETLTQQHPWVYKYTSEQLLEELEKPAFSCWL